MLSKRCIGDGALPLTLYPFTSLPLISDLSIIGDKQMPGEFDITINV